MNEEGLLELCEFGVALGEKLGTTDIEVHAKHENRLESELEMAQVSSVSKTAETKIAVRLFTNKKLGSAFTNIPSKQAIDEAVRMAFKAAHTMMPDSDFKGLSTPSEYNHLEGLWSNDVAEVEPSFVVQAVDSLIRNSVGAESRLIPAYGGSGAGHEVVAYANSNGVRHSSRGTMSYLYLGGIGKTDSGVTPAIVSIDFKRGLDLDISGVSNEVVRYVQLCMNSVAGKTGRFTVVMHPFALNMILEYTLLQSIRGDNVVRGKSKIGDRVGEQIASEDFSLYDDGLHPRGTATSVADDEGVPKQRTPIIENGVLRSFIWDTYWANKMGVKSTGNAKRDMRQGLIEIGKTNAVIPSGSRPISDIISDMDYGFMILNVQGAHSSNPESGDFSVVGNPAILIEKGELKGQVHGLMLSGNIFDMLKQVTEIASESHYIQNLISPEVVFREVSVIAKE